MPDFAKYSGIPFKLMGRDLSGCDCYGTVYLILRDEFGLDIPSYSGDYEDPNDRIEVGALINNEIKTRWVNIPRGSEQPGDVILLRVFGLPCHCGVVVGDRRFMHTIVGSNTCLERYDGPRWANRVLGFYRYRGYN